MIASLQSLLAEQLKDLYSAEKQLTEALPRMAQRARSPQLSQAFVSHLEETMGHVERLEWIATMLEFKPRAKKCRGMEGLIAEANQTMEEHGGDAALDAALIAAAQKVEHYEISGYASAKALAARLGNSKVVQLLDLTLGEEKAADEKFTSISEDQLLPAIPPEATAQRRTVPTNGDGEKS